jgi:uridine kinase
MLRRSFPHVKIVCGAVDEGLREAWLDGYDSEGPSATEGRKCWVVEPGMGQIGETFSYLRFCREHHKILCHRRSLLFIS